MEEKFLVGGGIGDLLRVWKKFLKLKSSV